MGFSLVFSISCRKAPLVGPAQPAQALPATFKASSQISFPAENFTVIPPEKAGINSERIAELDRYLFKRIGDDKDRKGIRTDCALLLKDGKIVYEKYTRGFHANRRHLIWSVTKSFINTLMGIAVADGKLKIEDYAAKYYPPLNEPGKDRIKIDDLLRMSSGLYWNEGYEASPLHSSVIAMLYTRGRGDMADFSARQKILHEPGTHWYYSSGTTNILSALLKNVYQADYDNLAHEKLFRKIGMKFVTFEKDSSGVYVGSSYIYTTARDLARLGLLYQNDGVWGKTRILPEGWVRYTTTMSKAYYTTPLTPHDYSDNPGAQWYINAGIPERNQPKPWPGAPADTFAGLGHWGQSIFVIPSLGIVAVRMADDRDGSFDKDTYLKLISGSVRK